MTIEQNVQHGNHEAMRWSEGNEWFLLREDVEVAGTVYRAGTPVQRSHDRWFVQGCDDPLSIGLDGRLCQTRYGGLSLHVVSSDHEGIVSHRRIGSDEPVERIAPSRVVSPPEPGHDRVYLAFGDQFYPLDYFGW
jgi:hypothetical protein